ncbi:MAG: PTS IIA-like nitrogen regulatory protein PtsN [Thiotrichales bacterium]
MNLPTLLQPERIACDLAVNSKKRALEQLSQLLAPGTPELRAESVFDCLLARERLGSTGLGRGVAIPHGRMGGIESARIAVIKLGKGVDFDAVDGRTVDLMFGLLVPSEATDEHLNLLAMLAELLSDDRFVAEIRKSATASDLHQLLKSHATRRAA